MTSGDKVRHVPFAERTAVAREVREEVEAVRWLLRNLRRLLPAASAAGRAIDRDATWGEILRLARWEEDWEVVGLLEDAFETLGRDLPEDVAGER